MSQQPNDVNKPASGMINTYFSSTFWDADWYNHKFATLDLHVYKISPMKSASHLHSDYVRLMNLFIFKCSTESTFSNFSKHIMGNKQNTINCHLNTERKLYWNST